MAFTGAGGGGPKAFSPFTINPNQIVQPPTSVASAPFSFGGLGGSGTAFAFGSGNNPVSATVSAPQLSFTAPTPAAAPSSLFNFGTAPIAAGTTPGGISSSIGAPTINFGLSSGTTAGIPAVTASVPNQIASFGVGSTQPPLSFGIPPTGSNQPIVPTNVAPISFSGVPATTSTATNIVQPSFGLPTTAQTTAVPTLSLGTATTTTAAPQSSFSFGGGTGSLNLATPIKPISTTASTATTSASATLGSDTTSATPQLTTTTTASQPGPANVSQMSFRQLQDAINKWMLDLQEEEKVFIVQATKVNAWDQSLHTNGDKIGKLNESVTKVNADHTRLEHAIDYLKTQQQEFEAFLEPLEAGLPINIPVEPEREHLYSLTENIDTQLQQMSEDLKEVIRHINESNKTVVRNDPISQILRILNEHTDALQWVEDNANAVRKSLEDVSQQHHSAKKIKI